MHFLIIQHVPFEGPARLKQFIESRGHSQSIVHAYQPGCLYPHLETVDVVVTMGGPMSANDVESLDWLNSEYHYLKRSLAAGKKLLGFCLGAQLLARLKGAQVTSNSVTEIGWFPVTWQQRLLGEPLGKGLQGTFTSYHWHSETFAIPQGCRLIASSANCHNQGFTDGKQLLALQFHPEMTEQSVQDLIQHCADNLHPSNSVMPAAEMLQLADSLQAENQAALFQLLDNWLAL